MVEVGLIEEAETVSMYMFILIRRARGFPPFCVCRSKDNEENLLPFYLVSLKLHVNKSHQVKIHKPDG